MHSFDVPRSELSHHLEELFMSRAYSDFKFITTDEAQIHAHKCILTARSAKLSTILEGKSEMKALATYEVMLEFLRFIYCEKVNNLFVVAAELLEVAQKYEITKLKNLCCNSLIENLTVTNAAKIASLADANDAQELRNLCITFIAK